MSADYQPLFERSKRNLQSSYEKFQPRTKYSSTTSKPNHQTTEFLSTEEQTWRPQSGLIRSRVIPNSSVTFNEPNQDFIESLTRRPVKPVDDYYGGSAEKRVEMSPNRSNNEQFLYSKSYIEQIKVRLENDKRELERKNVYMARTMEELKMNFEAKLRNSDLEKHECLNRNRKEIAEIESRYEKFTEALKLEISDLKKQREADHYHMKELEDSCLKANIQVNNANGQTKNLEDFVGDLKQQIRSLEGELRQKASANSAELQRMRNDFENEKNKLKMYFEGKIEKLRKETLKNEEILRNEVLDRQKKIAILESSLEESERNHTVFIESLTRDNQTLQETLKNKKNQINSYAAEIQKLNNAIDDLKREKYIMQTQIAISNQPNKQNISRMKE